MSSPSPQPTMTAHLSLVGYTPDPDDICPPWWPRRFPWPPRPRLEDLPADAALLNDLYQTLSTYVSAFQYADKSLRYEVQGASVQILKGQIEKFHGAVGGGTVAWDIGDDICPPWPWPKRGPRPVPPLPDPWRIPREGLIALNLLRAMTVYNIGAQLQDDALRGDMLKLATAQMGQQMERLQSLHG